MSKGWIARDDYQDIKELQHGVEAKTHLTKSTTTDQVYVVKRFSKYPVYASNPSSQQHDQPLPNEATILLKALRPHPNILRAFGCDLFGSRNSNLYSEFCSGGDLTEQVIKFASDKSTAPEALTLHVFISLAQALAYLHHGLHWDPEMKTYWQEPGFTPYIHGDIKPENTFLRWSEAASRSGLPDIVLGDFGQAQPAGHFRGVSGTEGYQAPEAADVWALGKSDVRAFKAAMRETGLMTTAADVYSLGQTVHMLGSGRLHVVGADPESKPVESTKNGMVGVRLGGVFGYDTEVLEKIVKLCLRVDPSLRPKVSEGSLLDAVGLFREALEQKMARRQALPRGIWASPPS